MQIVLPGALPEPREAGELAAYLIKNAPTLAQWLARARHKQYAADPSDTACLPHEYWQLAALGFQPAAGQNFATGLAALRGGAHQGADQPVWLAELVHVAPSRDGAALLPAAELAITPAQSVALFESVHEMFEESGFQLGGSGDSSWHVVPPEGYQARSASPALVAITSVNDWWPQDMASRPWRKLVNEVQMLWYEHPVNQERQRAGLPPINSLWLYGGARTGQLNALALPNAHIHDVLLAPAIRQDWSAWLEGLAWLEQDVFPALSSSEPVQLVLTGRERIVELVPGPRWTQWLPGNKDSWRKWWSPQN